MTSTVTLDDEYVLPLDGMRVLDLTDGVAARTTRFLAELGADVLLVEPRDGAPSRGLEPRCGPSSVEFATAHWNKRSVTIDLETDDGQTTFLRLAGGAEIVIEAQAPGYLQKLGIGPDLLRERWPSLVVVSITGFGQTGPYRDWRVTESVLVAMSSALTRSGAPGRAPLPPPGVFASETAAVQAAYVSLLARYRALRTGHGDYVDCSLYDMSVQGLDPGFGMGGSATAGRPNSDLPVGRPDVRMRYPIIACIDGHVRLCMLAPKHWQAMFDWLGRPDEFADPGYDKMVQRFKAWGQIRPHIERLFAQRTRAEILDEGTRRGIPIASLGSPAEILDTDHVVQRRSFLRAEVVPGTKAAVPNGYVEFDGVRAGFRTPAPHDTSAGADWLGAARPKLERAISVAEMPLDGVRVLDLGVIVAGGEAGRLLADQGADVIKVENRAFADGARQADRQDSVSYGFAVGNRGKRSIGLNLRSEGGRALFLQLVENSDVVLSNFKPGTMESLGLGFDALRAANPGIVALESSALGSSGPWSRRMGYGPLVRATVGLTTLWRHADSANDFGDDMTVYPDHAAARVAATAVVAALIAREESGAGRHVGIAQMEIVFMQLAADYLRESMTPGTLEPRDGVYEFDAPSGVYPCVGEDAFCVIEVRGDTDWRALANVIGRPDLAERVDLATSAGRVARRDEVDAILTGWTSTMTKVSAAQQLQQGGIAAGPAQHVSELLDDPHLAARGQFVELPQPGLPPPVVTESGPALFREASPTTLRKAPMMAEHTRAVCREVLGLSDHEIDDLVDDGVLEEHPLSHERRPAH
jgi:crotonobetainyl-CoA:carnitine CoA-transferase CaiB-like acyl-CoA transferase